MFSESAFTCLVPDLTSLPKCRAVAFSPWWISDMLAAVSSISCPLCRLNSDEQRAIKKQAERDLLLAH